MDVGQTLTVDFIMSLDGFGAADDWPGLWGYDSPEYIAWLERFLPTLPSSLRTPAIVTDRNDPKLAHLDGLNLSRAWCMRAICAVPPKRRFHRTRRTRSTARHPSWKRRL